MTRSETPNPYQSPATESSLSLSAIRFPFAMTVAALVPATAWLIYSRSFLGILLPGVIGILASGYNGWNVSRAASCSVLAYVIGVLTIALTNSLLPVAYPEMMNLLADDDWIRIETRIYAGSGVVGAIAGALGGLALHAMQTANLNSVQNTDQETEP